MQKKSRTVAATRGDGPLPMSGVDCKTDCAGFATQCVRGLKLPCGIICCKWIALGRRSSRKQSDPSAAGAAETIYGVLAAAEGCQAMRSGASRAGRLRRAAPVTRRPHILVINRLRNTLTCTPRRGTPSASPAAGGQWESGRPARAHIDDGSVIGTADGPSLRAPRPGAGPAVLRAHLFAATQRIALLSSTVLRPRRRWWTRFFPSRTRSTRRCSARTTCRATVSVGAYEFHPWAAPSRHVYVTGGRRRGRRIGAVTTLAVRQALVAEVPPGTFWTSALRYWRLHRISRPTSPPATAYCFNEAFRSERPRRRRRRRTSEELAVPGTRW